MEDPRVKGKPRGRKRKTTINLEEAITKLLKEAGVQFTKEWVEEFTKDKGLKREVAFILEDGREIEVH